jgi:hypothetical protein
MADRMSTISESDGLVAENERLRGALAVIDATANGNVPGASRFEDRELCFFQISEIARQALSPSGKEG